MSRSWTTGATSVSCRNHFTVPILATIYKTLLKRDYLVSAVPPSVCLALDEIDSQHTVCNKGVLCLSLSSADAPGQRDSEKGPRSNSGIWKLYERWKSNSWSSWRFQPRHLAKAQGCEEQCKRKTDKRTYGNLLEFQCSLHWIVKTRVLTSNIDKKMYPK